MILIMDIDGTIANSKARFKKAGPEPRGRGPAYYQWLAKVQSEKSLMKDKPVPGMMELISILHKSGHGLFYLTGREELYRDLTREWLIRNGFPAAPLHMRPTNDSRSNGKFKEDTVNRIYTRWSVGDEPIILVDDDFTGEIEKVCKKKGWTFLKARSGS